MSNNVKTYFLTPSWDHPPNGVIRLGSIIASPTKATQPLNVGTRKDPEQDSLIPSYKSYVTWSKEKQRKGKYGLWTAFLSNLGIGADASYEREDTIENTYSFDRMDTVEFLPSEAYIRESINDPLVMRFLDISYLRKPLYMITGIKMVRGASAKTARRTSRKAGLKLGLNAASTGAPISFGPEIGLDWAQNELASFDGSSDFVFAFQVRKIILERKGLASDIYSKGAMYDADGLTQNSSTILAVRDEGIKASAGDPSLESSIMVDDDDDGECVCAIFNP